MVRLARAGEVVAALDGAGIRALVLKGAALLEASGELGLREMADVDVLVDRDHIDRAGSVLRGLGYERFVQPGREWSARLHYARAYLRGGDLGVDLHARIVPHYLWSVDHEGLWRRAVPVSLGKTEGRRPCAEDMVLHAALNAAKDMFPTPERLARDLATLASALPIDWKAVVVRARQWRASVAAHWALDRARRTAGAEIPAPVIDDLRPPGWRLRALERALASERVGALPLAARRALVGPVLIDAPLGYAGWVARAAVLRALDRGVPRPHPE